MLQHRLDSVLRHTLITLITLMASCGGPSSIIIEGLETLDSSLEAEAGELAGGPMEYPNCPDPKP